MSKFKLILTKQKQFPIYELLKIEESIMRVDKQKENIYIFLNEGTPQKSIIMGASGQVEKLVFKETVKQDNIPIIKRFTGGGTVLVDHQTVFVSFIGSNKFLKELPFDKSLQNKILKREKEEEQQIKVYPEDIMKWTSGFYSPIFPQSLQFELKENDYIFHGGKKFGGNAQYITGGKLQRWVHHTSFLWDYHPNLMEKYLTLPEKKPEYRSSRSHTDFLTSLKFSLNNCPENNLNSENYGNAAVVPENNVKEAKDFIKLIENRIFDLCQNGEWKDRIEDIKEVNDFVSFQPFVKENTMIRTKIVNHDEDNEE
ncbi:hypothetical protein ABK040_002260 [Willaertia magna]